MKKKSTRKNLISLQRTTMQVLTGTRLAEPVGGIVPVITNDTVRQSAHENEACN